MISNDWFFGLDAGGTQTRLYAHSELDGADFELFGGPANVLRQGSQQTASTLSSLISDALKNLHQGNLCAVHAGVAGAGSPQIQEDLADRIRDLVKSSIQISVSHDGVIALEGAFTGKSGLLFIAGTGSGVMARTGTGILDVHHVGGWGHLIGDEGSGHAIGREAVTAVARAFDGGPGTQLTHLVRPLHITDRHSLLRTITHPNWKFQQVAPLLLRAAANGDQVALTIVGQQAQALVEQAKWLLKKFPDLNPRFTMIGGLSNNELYVQTVRHAMKNIWPEAVYIRPLHSPAQGAAQIAMRQFRDSDDFQSTHQPQ